MLRCTIQRLLSPKLTFALTGATYGTGHGMPVARSFMSGSYMRKADLGIGRSVTLSRPIILRECGHRVLLSHPRRLDLLSPFPLVRPGVGRVRIDERMSLSSLIFQIGIYRFFDVSSGFEHSAGRASDHVNHGDEGLHVAIAAGPGPCCLEQAVEPFQTGVGIGRGPAPYDPLGMGRQRR